MDYQQAYTDLVLADKISLRERLVMHFSNRGCSAIECIDMAEILAGYIQNGASPKPTPKSVKAKAPKKAAGPKKKRGRPPKVQTVTLTPSKKKKRKYTKRSPRWGAGELA